MADPPAIEGFDDPVAIGQGGFAVVYQARQARFDRVVALKVLTAGGVDERARSRFERECRVMGHLSWHPNVVAVFDSGVADGHPWLAMELLDAGSLADRLARTGALPWLEAVDIGIQVAGALGAAHASGVLHRDLKPENLLVGPFGEAKLADFGIAAVEGGTRTTTGHASFTVAHVAPEILEGQRPDERSDVYGLASTLHTLIAGTPPFAGQSDESIAAAITRVLQSPAPRLDGVPAALADLAQQCLAKDPADRPPTAEALGRALQEVQEGEGLPTTALRLAPTHATGTSAAAEATSAPDPDVTVARRKTDGGGVPTAPSPAETDRVASSAGRPRTGIVLAVVAALALVVGAVIVLASGGDDGVGSGGGGGGTPQVVATIEVGQSPRDVAVTDEAVWVTTYDDSTVARIDRATNEVSATGAADNGPQAITATGDQVWVANYSDGTITALDAATGEPVTTLAVDGSPQDLAVVGEDVWVSLLDDAAQQVEPVTGDRGDPVALPAGPQGIAATDEAVWVTSLVDDELSRIDPSDGTVVTSIDTGDGSGPRDVAVTDDAVWVTCQAAGTLLRIDPATDEIVATVDVGGEPMGVAVTDDAVWVAVSGSDEVVRVDPEQATVTDRLDVGANPLGLAAAGESVWVANADDGTVSRIDLG